jgi:hypothetical protein
MVRGRATAGALALAGLLVLMPSIFWPTGRLTFYPPDDPSSPPLGPIFSQVTWSWGRVVIEDVSEGMVMPTQNHLLVLGVLVTMVLAGFAGAAAWLMVPGVRGRLLGVAGTAVVGAHAVDSVSRRLVQNSPNDGMGMRVDVETPVAGLLEMVSAVLLPAALLVMLWRPLLSTSRAAWRTASGRARAAREVDQSKQSSLAPASQGGVIFRGEHTDGESLPSRVLDVGPAKPVGFTDRTADDDRFRPPPSP